MRFNIESDSDMTDEIATPEDSPRIRSFVNSDQTIKRKWVLDAEGYIKTSL